MNRSDKSAKKYLEKNQASENKIWSQAVNKNRIEEKRRKVELQQWMFKASRKQVLHVQRTCATYDSFAHQSDPDSRVDRHTYVCDQHIRHFGIGIDPSGTQALWCVHSKVGNAGQSINAGTWFTRKMSDEIQVNVLSFCQNFICFFFLSFFLSFFVCMRVFVWIKLKHENCFLTMLFCYYLHNVLL